MTHGPSLPWELLVSRLVGTLASVVAHRSAVEANGGRLLLVLLFDRPPELGCRSTDPAKGWLLSISPIPFWFPIFLAFLGEGMRSWGAALVPRRWEWAYHLGLRLVILVVDSLVFLESDLFLYSAFNCLFNRSRLSGSHCC
ncbi:hypothetical protein CSUI_004266 [Cystoisospora suis]|uniref:Transmembrane protein n=1 Tax=Cystoisospora suis TaxID=483139 RepID=A0A2C6L2C0_9APIC|nr:hypothetical protein CSUI_004266 [Cystoisospora suis]